MGEKFIPEEAIREDVVTPETEVSAEDTAPTSSRPRSSFLKKLAFGLTLAGASAEMHDAEAKKPHSAEASHRHHEAGHPSYFDNPNFFTSHPHGDFSKKFENVAPGVVILPDTGLDFYVVQAEDLNVVEGVGKNRHRVSPIDVIKKKLAKIKKYAHVDDTKDKLKTFNIPNKLLVPGMYIPIPLKPEQRRISDEYFKESTLKALKAILGYGGEDEAKKNYARLAKEILAQPGMTMEKMVASILAIAKKESGSGGKLGEYELHRWEGGSHDCFSFSYMHVLMEGPGIKARQNLDLTEGQTYHPENAVKLFIGYLYENIGLGARKFFPLDDNLKSFSRFYNGPNYKANSYDKVLGQYYNRALGKRPEAAPKKQTKARPKHSKK